MKHEAPRITDQLVAQLAQAADVDTRSVVRVLAGLPVRGRSGVRIARVLETHGLARSTSTAPRAA